MRRTSIHFVLVAIMVAALPIGSVWGQEGKSVGEEENWSRDYLMIVGSGTVFPFARAVVDHLSSEGEIAQPMMQAMGSGGGLMLFCAGTGEEDVDITCSSRRMRASEFANCEANGVGEIVEVRIGFDGIVLASSREAEAMSLSFRDIWLALAAEVPDPEGGEKLVPNPYSSWRELNPDLPDRAIKLFGPAPGTGTRTIFNRLAMEGGCDSFEWIRGMRKEAPVEHRAICRSYRDEGVFQVADVNNRATVEKIAAEPGAVAVISYPAYVRNEGAVRGLPVEGVEPTYEAIADASYPVARPLYLYAKKDHVRHTTGLRAFLNELTTDAAFGEEGYLEDLGLVLLSLEERRMWAEIATSMSPMEVD